MNIVKAGFEVLREKDITKKIELVARTCYKSEDQICDGSDIKMVRNLLERRHTAMLEHASLCFEVSETAYLLISSAIKNLQENATLKMPYKNYLRFTSNIATKDGIRCLISGNMRAWLETAEHVSACDNVVKALRYGILPEVIKKSKGIIPEMVYHEKEKNAEHACGNDAREYQLVEDFSRLSAEERMVHEDMTVRFTVDRGVTHELVRMRDASFAQESTRYCNYMKNKFGSEITVVKPCFFDEGSEMFEIWKKNMMDSENAYFALLAKGAKPQQARDVLPTSIKAEIVLTANLREWRHIFSLRACDATGPAHPQMKEVMIPLFKQVKKEYPFAFGDLIAAE